MTRTPPEGHPNLTAVVLFKKGARFVRKSDGVVITLLRRCANDRNRWVYLSPKTGAPRSNKVFYIRESTLRQRKRYIQEGSE